MGSMELSPGDQSSIKQAVAALKLGQLVAFPTETVYGLGADAANPEALQRLYNVKGRPASHPVIVHLSSLAQLRDWASTISPAAFKLAETFWPGPLTLILPKAQHVLDQVTGGQTSVGLRIPSHPLALALLREFSGGVAAPSANKFGRLSATCAEDVAAELGADVAVVLDGGPCDLGIESTIVDFSQGSPQILRPGMILAEHIEAIIGPVARAAGASTPSGGKDLSPLPPRVPGGLPSHYAPLTPLRLVESQSLEREIEYWRQAGKSVCVLSFSQATLPGVIWLAASREPFEYARHLYRNLRMLDQKAQDLILVESPPGSGEWSGIADRLARASVKESRTKEVQNE